MRAKTECRRCGCGAILSLRESCKACSDAARARLHAEGFCRRDGTGQPYDCGKPPLGPRPAWVDAMPGDFAKQWDRLDDAGKAEMNQLEREQAERRKHRWADFHELVRQMCLDHAVKHRPPPVGAEVSYEVALADMQRRPEARYRERREANGTTRWEGGQQMYQLDDGGGDWPCENGAEDNASFRWTRLPDATTVPAPASTADKRCYCVDCRFERMEITSGERGWYRARGHKEPCIARHTPTDGIPPAIGEEVAWERSKADMMARPQGGNRGVALYSNSGWPGAMFCWAGELKASQPRDERWHKVELYEPENARWMRLA